MSGLLPELVNIISGLGLFVVTGVHDADIYKPPNRDEYVVIIPMSDTLNNYADDEPGAETREARLSLFCRNDYMQLERRLTRALLKAGLDITSRYYVGWEKDTKYYHYAIDVAKNYYFDVEGDL